MFIMYIVYNKFITFLSYFNHDRKCPNSNRIVVDQGRKQILPCSLTKVPGYTNMSVNYAQHRELSHRENK